MFFCCLSFPHFLVTLEEYGCHLLFQVNFSLIAIHVTQWDVDLCKCCTFFFKNMENFFVNNLRKFRKLTLSLISHLGDSKEVWYKDWKMGLHKLGEVRACFCWITEKPQIIQLQISFHDDNFCVDFVSKMQILSYLV